MGAQQQPRLHLGLPGVGAVRREPVADRGVRLLLPRHLLDHGEPFGALRHIGQRLFQRVLGLGRGRGAALGLARRALRLAGEPPELLGHPGLRLFARAAPLGQFLDQVRALPAAGLGVHPGPGQLPAPDLQSGQVGVRLVDGGLHLDEAGRSGGPALRQVRPEHVSRDGHRDQLGPRGHQRLGIRELRHHPVVPHDPPHGPPHPTVPTDQLPHGHPEVQGAHPRHGAHPSPAGARGRAHPSPA